MFVLGDAGNGGAGFALAAGTHHQDLVGGDV